MIGDGAFAHLSERDKKEVDKLMALIKSLNEASKYSVARGRDLDSLAEIYGLKRKKYFWIFKEWDRFFKKRLIAALDISVIHS